MKHLKQTAGGPVTENEDTSEEYIGVKEFKCSVETSYVPTVNTSGDNLKAVGML